MGSAVLFRIETQGVADSHRSFRLRSVPMTSRCLRSICARSCESDPNGTLRGASECVTLRCTAVLGSARAVDAEAERGTGG